MNTIIFAKSSSDPDSPYGVSVVIEDRKLFIECPCPAGGHGTLCKHRVAFLKGDESMLYNPEQKPLLDQLQIIAAETTLGEILDKYLTQMSELEELKGSFKKTKRQLARTMDEGVHVNKGIAEKYGGEF